jgi:hypothetical protein
MRIQTASALTIILVLVPSLEAQRRGGGMGRPGRSSGPPANRQAGRLATQRPLPSTPILPMTNPIGPVVPYGGAGRRLNNPTQLPVLPGGNFLSRIERRRDVPVVIGAPYWSPYYGPYVWDYMYYDPYLRPATIPGQLPGVYPLPPEPASSVYQPDPAPIREALPPEPETIYYPEPKMIINLPEPGREPPAIGTSRADVLARYGQPWGSLTVRGQETLQLRGDLKVVLEGDRVIQVR